jgi:hypothetical protein
MKNLIDSIFQPQEYNVTFVSQKNVDFLELLSLFPKSVVLYDNISLLETVCTFLTADILITSGSSFAPVTAAFGQPFRPIIFEERRKDVFENDSMFDHHYYSSKSAVLLEDGELVSFSIYEVRSLIESKFM